MRYSLSIPAVLMGLVLLADTLSAAAADAPADAVAGKAKADQFSCAGCHEPADWKGQSAAQLRTKISDVVAGKVKHKTKIKLADQDIADIAAYWSAGQ